MKTIFILISIFLSLTAFADFSKVHSVRHLYLSGSVGVSDWAEVTTLPGTAYAMSIFDSSGQTMQLGVGAAGSETELLKISPGGGDFPVKILSGSRVSIRALSSAATSGEYIFNFFY